MGYIRNPEIKKEIVIFILLWLVSGISAGLLFGFPCFLLATASTLLFSLFHFGTSYFRYKKIACLADEIDSFLHDSKNLSILHQQEGELAILETEIAKMVQKLELQAEQLQADKIYLLNSIADISHQIRTPLTSLNLIISRLSQKTYSEEKRQQLLHELEILLRHIDWLIQTLLKISKLDAGTIRMREETVSVRELLQKTVRELAISIELRNQNIFLSCPEDVSYAGDELWIQEALCNIVKNCVEHTPKGGSLWLEAEENAIYTQIIIRDNGPGISKKDLPHLFERFYKGENSSAQSVGIGLALAKMIIKRQGGIITAENDIRGGACFKIRFYKSIV